MIVIVEENDSSPVPEPAPVESKPEQMEDVEMEDKPRVVIPKEALVPFANPLADDKQTKKLLRTVKKGMAYFCSGTMATQSLPIVGIQDWREKRDRAHL